MNLLRIAPSIYKYDSFSQFATEFDIGATDLVFTHEFIYSPFMRKLGLACNFMFYEKYGASEPDNAIADAILADMGDKQYKRVIAVGGGSLIDTAKLMALQKPENTLALFEGKCLPVKEKELVIIPTTCGTGSEVTNISILGLSGRGTKKGLVSDALFADAAVLIPELVMSLPYRFFVYSSIDALIHAFESYVSPKSGICTELFAQKAIDTILRGYLEITKNGADARYNLLDGFLTASTLSGVAFSNTGVGAVHALSYPLGGVYHVPHGEANYQFFTAVFDIYRKTKPDGNIKKLNDFTSEILNVDSDKVYRALAELLGKLIPLKRLCEYGMKPGEIESFTDSVIENQQRLLANNYVPFSREDIEGIYRELF